MRPSQAVERPQAEPAQLSDDDVLLTSAQTRARFGGISNMCIWRWERDPRVRFPAPDVVINGRRYWRLRTLRRFDAERVRLTAEQTAA